MMAMTSDGGRTWAYSQPVPDAGVTQPSLVEFRDGTLGGYFRNSDPRHRIKRSASRDGGITWAPLELTDLLHPGGGIEAILGLDEGEWDIVLDKNVLAVFDVDGSISEALIDAGGLAELMYDEPDNRPHGGQ